MKLNLRVALDFVNYPDPGLGVFANNVVVSMTDNIAFPASPVSVTDLGDLVTAFDSAVLAAVQGGLQLTAAKNAARVALVDALRKIASYVQSVASQNLDVLLTSGFYANSTNRTQNPLDPPTIIEISNLATTKFLVRLTPVLNAKAYNLRICVVSTVNWQDAGIYTQARRIVIGNLVSGSTYQVIARAIGGSTGASEWSVAVTLMAT
jgi:hypothetical protein